MALARILATTPFGRGFLPHGPYQLQTVLFGVQIKLADLSATALRITQIGIAQMLGLVLILAAIHDLAGARASRLGGVAAGARAREYLFQQRTARRSR